MDGKIITIHDLQGRRLVQEIIDIITHIPEKDPWANDNRRSHAIQRDDSGVSIDSTPV